MSAISDLSVASANSNYFVTSRREEALSSDKNRIFLCDEKVKAQAMQMLGGDFPWIIVKASEELKTLESCALILEEMAVNGANRDSQLVAIGGGAVQDIATLVASLYMRGIDWLYVPTTLMAMMDSCIGGKSSINVGKFKNLVGNYNAPTSIYINVAFSSTLSPEDISCGVAEGAKICFAAGSDSFLLFVSLIEKWRESGSEEDLGEAIFLSLSKKKWFIERDEFDRNERKLLNFGHSFGHALEASTSFTVPHGIAVLIGMEAALIKAQVGAVTSALANFIRAEVVHSCFDSRKITIDEKVFLAALEKDKKNSFDLLNLILPQSDGALAVTSFPLTQEELKECLSSTREALSELGIDNEVL